MTGPMDMAKDLWLAQGLPIDFLKHLHFHGDPDTAINSSFKLGTIAQVSRLGFIRDISHRFIDRQASVSLRSPQRICTI